MGLMGRILGMGGTARTVGDAVTGVAEVFVGNRAAREAAESASFNAVTEQYGAEFAHAGGTWFDGFVNSLNRLPRPMLALGTLGLFIYAMAEPAGFSVRMQGLALVPEPLWWLLGAIVSFYFGARELHYRRGGVALPVVAAKAPAQLVGFALPPRPRPQPAEDDTSVAPVEEDAVLDAAALGDAVTTTVRAADPQFNAAVEDWRRLSA